MKASEKLIKFCKRFPNSATKWSQATDEIKDVSNFLRVQYNETNDKGIKINAPRLATTPSEWNKGYSTIIKECVKILPESELNDCVELYSFI